MRCPLLRKMYRPTLQPEACNFCDDIFAEAADMVVADAWLPRCRAEWRGTSLIVTRTAMLATLLREGADAGELWLEPTPLANVIESQGGNVRRRRAGLAVRLADDIGAGLKVPRKQVPPGYDGVDAKRISLIRQRRLLSKLSFTAFRDAALPQLFASRKPGGPGVVVDSLDMYAATVRKPYARYRATAGTRRRNLASRALATPPGLARPPPTNQPPSLTRGDRRVARMAPATQG